MINAQLRCPAVESDDELKSLVRRYIQSLKVLESLVQLNKDAVAGIGHLAAAAVHAPEEE